MRVLVTGALTKKVIKSGGGVDGAPYSSGSIAEVPPPAGAFTFTVKWATEPGVDGYAVLLDSTAKSSLDPYDWLLLADGQATTQRVVLNVASGTYNVRVCGRVGSRLLEPSFQRSFTG